MIAWWQIQGAGGRAQDGGRGRRPFVSVFRPTLLPSSQSYLLACLDLAITLPSPSASAAGATPTASVSEVAAWRPPARVTATTAGAPTPGAALLVAGTADGSLCRLRLRVPTAPGASVADAELDDSGGTDHDGAGLVPWRAAAHAGAVTAVSLDASSSRLVSGGADGALCVTDVSAGRGAGPASPPILPPCPSVTIVDAAWRTAADVATLAAGGGRVRVGRPRFFFLPFRARAPPPPPRPTPAPAWPSPPPSPTPWWWGRAEGGSTCWM